MKIALIGYGKMGKEIEKIAIERAHEIVLKIEKPFYPQKDFVTHMLPILTIRLNFHPSFLIPVFKSYFSNSSLSSWLQFLPMGEIFSMPFLNSINVPRFMGISSSAIYFSTKLINSFNFSSPRNCFIL